MRLYRKRCREGIQLVRIPLRVTEIDDLIRMGRLKQDQRDESGFWRQARTPDQGGLQPVFHGSSIPVPFAGRGLRGVLRMTVEEIERAQREGSREPCREIRPISLDESSAAGLSCAGTASREMLLSTQCGYANAPARQAPSGGSPASLSGVVHPALAGA